MQILNTDENIYTVSRLNNEVRFLLEDTFPLVWVEGEMSNFAAPHSGHWYFSLKDSAAQVRCCLFKGQQKKVGFTPKDGAHVLIRARACLYEARGEYQLIAEHMEERGEGKLRRAYELLKKKLEAAGLFDGAHKQDLPLFPRQIGVVTSATGAAIRDILTVLKRRYPCAPVIIYPSLVQGQSAAPNIVQAIQTANRRQECDILIVARGGGSLEDLWLFNEESVAMAIYQSQIPIISGVGHEVDFTIADFVADKRAPTPSAAAEMITPDQTDLLRLLMQQGQQIARRMLQKMQTMQQTLTWAQKHLSQQHPKRRLVERMQHLDFCELSLVQLQTQLLTKYQTKLRDLEARLHRLLPIHRIRQLENVTHVQEQKLLQALMMTIQQRQTMLVQAAAKLDALSPLATLQRGYAIVTKNQRVLRNANEVSKGDRIEIRLLKGSLACTVE